jgi:ribosomal protein S18 acetylase RimI-like enzyme
MVIRTATLADAETLARLAERTFRDAFAADNQPDDMDAYCASAFAPDVMRGYLADASISTIVTAGDDGALVAYAQLRDAASDDVAPMEKPLELWRFYVDQVHHGRGVAQRMMAAVIDVARARGAETLWLGVWEHNARAQAFYRKFGFVVVGTHTFVLGSDVQTDRVMARSVR